MSSQHKNIVVVGGGLAGVQVVKDLLPKLDTTAYSLTIINPRPFTIHILASARAVVTNDQNLENRALIPYDKLLSDKATLVLGKVASIDRHPNGGGVVVLENEKTVPFDILVLATGSIWPSSVAWPETRAAIDNWLSERRRRVQSAKNVVIAGGGAVGLELAGEIRHYHPNVNVTVVHKGEHLLNDTYPDRYRVRLEEQAQKLGVKLVLDDTVVSEHPDAAGFAHTSSGKKLPADVVIPAVGIKPNTSFLQSLGPDVLTADHFVRVSPTLQLPSYPEIFAIGDIISWPEQKQSAKVKSQSSVVATNIAALTKNLEPTAKYTGFMEAILVTLGPTHGVGWIPLLGGWIMGDWLARMLKSKDLMVSGARKNLGYE